VLHVIGEVKGRRALIVDDIVDTGGTLVQACEALLQEGAKEVFSFCSHAVLSGSAVEKIEKSVLKKLIATDSIALDEKVKRCSKIEVLNVAPLFGEAIRRMVEAGKFDDARRYLASIVTADSAVL
jgi:ribose-phosphate pyrophosphokinase